MTSNNTYNTSSGGPKPFFDDDSTGWGCILVGPASVSDGSEGSTCSSDEVLTNNCRREGSEKTVAWSSCNC